MGWVPRSRTDTYPTLTNRLYAGLYLCIQARKTGCFRPSSNKFKSLSMTPLRNALLTTSLCLAVILYTPAQAENTTPTPDSLRSVALEATKANQWPQSLEAWGRYLQVRPEDEEGWRKHGYALGQLGRHEEAVASYRRATELKPNSNRAWNGMCWHQILAGQFSAARPSCEKAVAIDPTSYAPAVNLGHTWMLEGKTEAANVWYRKALLLITDEADLKQAPLADFDIFIQQGWEVEESRQAKAWFAEQGNAWLARKAPADKLLAEAKAAEADKDLPKALNLRQQRMTLLGTLYGQAHPITIGAMDALADLHIQAKQAADALPLYQRVLAWREKQPEGDAAKLAVTLNDVAKTLAELKQTDESLRYKQRAVGMAIKAWGDDDKKTLTLSDQLAEAYSNAGRHADALPLYQRVLAGWEKQPEVNAANLAFTLNDVAKTLAALKQTDESLRYKQRAVGMAKKAWGDDDTTTLSLSEQLADAYAKVGQHADALPLYQRVLAWREKQPESAAANLADTLNDVARTFTGLARYAEAEPLYRRALAIDEKTLGPNHPKVASRLINLAGLLKTTGRHAEVEPLHRRALAIGEKTFGPDHPSVVAGFNNLAFSYRALGQHDKALALFEKVFAGRTAKLGKDHPDTLASMSNLATTYIALDQRDKALALFEKVFAGRTAKLGKDHPDTLASMSNLATTYSDLGQYDNMSKLASTYSELGQRDKALALLEKILVGRTAKLGAGHPDTLSSMEELARTYFHLHQATKALEWSKKVVAGRRASLGLDHADTLASMDFQSDIYIGLGLFNETLNLNHQVNAARYAKLGADHPDTRAGFRRAKANFNIWKAVREKRQREAK